MSLATKICRSVGCSVGFLSGYGSYDITSYLSHASYYIAIILTKPVFHRAARVCLVDSLWFTRTLRASTFSTLRVKSMHDHTQRTLQAYN